MANLTPRTHQIGNPQYQGRAKYARAVYEFAVHGGAVSAITLSGDTVPAGVIVIDSLVHVHTAVTSGGAATIALGVETATDLDAAQAITSVYNTAGPKRLDLTATSAPLVTTVDRAVRATVATAALTAGRFSVVVTYLELA